MNTETQLHVLVFLLKIRYELTTTIDQVLIVCVSNYHPGGYILLNLGRLFLPEQYHQSTIESSKLPVKRFQFKSYI